MSEVQPLPRTSLAWVIAVVISAAALGFGIYGYYDHYEHGFIVSGMRDPGRGGAAWGLSIIFYVFFVGVSFAGITVAAMSRLFHIEVLKPITRLAELLTITALIAGACGVLTDLGRIQDGLLKLPRYANPPEVAKAPEAKDDQKSPKVDAKADAKAEPKPKKDS